MAAIPHGASARTAMSAVMRAFGLFVLWLLIAGPGQADLVVGIVTAALATWVSLVLLPPAKGSIRLGPLVSLETRLLGQSIVAGVDVARRALAPRVVLNPGFVAYRCTLPDGPARSVFSMLMSLVPGTLPVDAAADGTLTIHCLDVAQPVARGMAKDEALLRRALPGDSANV
jgi:multicomponent Na+:H+ antiporter subunit E